jgi:DNA sulfur modification protein DndD
MFLRYLELVNIGVFSEKHRISFERTSRLKPVTLIGALNGGGKTTILNSLQLALYGNRSFGIERTRKNYKEYLKELKHRTSSVDSTSSVELCFDLRQNGTTSTFKIQRIWRCTNNTSEESFIVLKNDVFDDFLSSNWSDFMESILPSKLAHLFFFDGEQIEQMADETSAQMLLKTAFKSLLGLDVVERLQEDLMVLERRKKTSVHSPTKQNKIYDLELACEREQQKLQNLHQEIVHGQHVLDQVEKEISSLKEVFKEKGGESFEKRGLIENNIEDTQKAVQGASADILELISGAAFLIPLIGRLDTYIRETDADSLVIQNEYVLNYINKRDTEILAGIKACTDQALFKKINNLFKPIGLPQTNTFGTTILDYSSLQKIIFLTKEHLPSSYIQLKEKLAILKGLRAELIILERQLATAPDLDAIKDLNHKLNENSNKKTVLEARLADLAQVFRQTEIELNSYKKLLNNELEIDLEAYKTQNHQQRILTYIPKVSSTLKDFSEKVLKRHVGALEAKITECFQYLIRKPDFIQRITINPIDFKLTLHDVDQATVPFSLLSAGERQVLATSILWGLSKVSGRPIPLVIDTPLGRLDSNHRSNLVQRYFPSASHQVILLSTDEEIVNGYHETLRPFISKSFLLEFDPKKKCSSIKEDYFNK